MEISNENIRFGICPECKVRYNDSSEKKLQQCPYCKEWFCEKHIEPKLVVTWNEIQGTKDPFLKEKLYEEWKKEGGHPDSIWTMQYFESLEIKEKEEREKFLKALDRVEKIGEINLYSKSSKVTKNEASSKEALDKIEKTEKTNLYDKSSEVSKKEMSSKKDLDNMDKMEKINKYSKSSEVNKRKISSKDVAVVLALILCFFLIILLNYPTAVHYIMIYLFIILVLFLIIVIFI